MSKELLSKIAGIVVTYNGCDLLDLQVGLLEEGCGLHGTLFMNKIYHTLASFNTPQNQMIFDLFDLTNLERLFCATEQN